MSDIEDEVTVFAETTFRGQRRRFGIKTDDRRRHMYLIGKTGMGKSTIMENMIVEDIRAGRGVAVVDPHGDLAEKIIEFIPANRINDVIYFNPADINYPIAFNVVEHVEPHLRHLVASGLLGVFRKLWADSWGPRLEYILRNSILAVLDYPDSTLMAVIRMLSDKEFRKKIIEQITDPVVKAFWVNEFAGYNDKFASEAIAPIQNKVGQFLSSSLIRNIVGQIRSSVDIRKVMDERKILILNLSKGRIGEDNMQLMGSMMITKIQLAAMSRVDIPEHERRDFYLYVDEFQNFATDSFANILSEARKYHLNLILAHQYIEQLGEVVRPAVFGNVGTMVVFRVGAADAEALVPEFTPVFTEEDIVNLPKYEFYLKLMIDGVASNPFSARGMPPLQNDEKTGNFEKVVASTRERYAKPRLEVEEKIARWHLPGGDSPDRGIVTKAPNATKAREMRPVANPSEAPKQQPFAKAFQTMGPSPVETKPSAARPVKAEASQVIPEKEVNQAPIPPALPEQTIVEVREPAIVQPTREDKKLWPAQCSRCAAETRIAFEPDGIRPIYCKSCLQLSKEEKARESERRRQAKQLELASLAAQAPIPAPQVQTTSPVAQTPVLVEKVHKPLSGLAEMLAKQNSAKSSQTKEISLTGDNQRATWKPSTATPATPENRPSQTNIGAGEKDFTPDQDLFF